jgi:hypothetical protein
MSMKNRMHIGRNILCAMLLLQGAAPLWAQVGGNNNTNDEVIVIKQYESTLQDADRISFNPTIPDAKTTVDEKLTYTNTDVAFKSLKFEPNALKPIALGKEKPEKHNTSFIKLGFGTQLTPLAQLMYNGSNIKNTIGYGLWYNHLSAKGFKVKYQQFSDDALGAYVNFKPGQGAVEIGTSFSFRNLRTHFYGADSAENRKAIFQRLRSYDGNVYFKNAKANKIGLNFRQDLRFNYFQGYKEHANEWLAGGTTYLEKGFAKYHHVEAKLDFDITQYKADSISQQRNIFRFLAGYFFDNDDWFGRGNIGFAMDGKKAYLQAQLAAEKKLYKNYLIVFGKWNYGLDVNTYGSFATANNFVAGNIPLANTRTSDVETGFKGTAKNLNYKLAFHYLRQNNKALFINDSAHIERFDVIYDRADIFRIKAEAGYNIKEDLRVGLSVQYNLYKMKVQQHAWHEPALNLALSATYNIQDKILVGADFYALAGAYALVPGGYAGKTTPELTAKLIKGTADINLRAEYIFKNYLSFFANFNNLAHQKYQRYYRYQSYGFNCVGGVKFSF